jgi:hypothetical protein
MVDVRSVSRTLVKAKLALAGLFSGSMGAATRGTAAGPLISL